MMCRLADRLSRPLLLVLLSSGGCAEPSPSAPLVPPPPGPAAPFSFEMWTVRGTVWKHTDRGVEPAPVGAVYGWIEQSTYGAATGTIPVRDDGRFEFAVPAGTTRVRVTAAGFQPCAVTVVPDGDVTVNVHTVPREDLHLLGASLPTALRSQEPTLSGVVYEQTPSGRQPLVNARVTLDASWGLGNQIADTLTDAHGRYVLCAVPHLPGLSVVVGLTGFEVSYSAGDLSGATTLDVAMRRLRPGQTN